MAAIVLCTLLCVDVEKFKFSLLLVVEIMIFYLWIPAMWNKLETCELIEFVYVLEKCLGR
jgi:hypothetical protein